MPTKQFTPEEVKEHYKNCQHLFALDPYVVRDKVLEYLISLKGNSYYEFGCNCGFNLNHLKERLPLISAVGMDINQFSIDYGKDKFKSVSLMQGDENWLAMIPPNFYDIVFTSSVLCHIPKVDDVIDNLKRITKKHLVCMESNVDEAPNFWKHNYEQYGFKPEFEVINPRSEGHEMLYRCYTIHNEVE